jgi:hypothetical protein
MLAIAVLAVLRIGAPLVVIFGVSYLAYRWIGDDKATQPVAVEKSAALGGRAPMAQVLYAGPHCWDDKGCTPEMKATCPAFARPELPCWLAVQMKTGHLNKNCTDCDFYERPVARA